jgi:hypothetical protein
MAMTHTQHRTDVDSAPRAFSALDWIAMTLLIIGGINWGLVGLAQFDLVAALFGGEAATLSRIVYLAVGLSALYCIYTAVKVNSGARRS